MFLYMVNISSGGNGLTEEKTAEGEVTEADGAVRVKYNLDGDECVLTVKDKTVTQERRGEQCVKISFKEGERTQCVIGSGGLIGSYEVFTQSIKFLSGKGGYKLSLEYLNGSDKEPIKLLLTAVKKGNSYEN